jgi:hypothetical protein
MVLGDPSLAAPDVLRIDVDHQLATETGFRCSRFASSPALMNRISTTWRTCAGLSSNGEKILLHYHPTPDQLSVITVRMKSTPCPGALAPREILRLETEPEMRLHTCALCGKRNLYAVKDGLGRWAPEVHNKPSPRKTSARSARKIVRR